MTESTTIRWGIMGPGNIARTFAHNILTLAPSHPTRSKSVTHTITAVASRALSSAESFISNHVTPHQPTSTPCTAYPSYLSLAQSHDVVDMIYIATPHSSHFANAMLAVTNGKPVLVEKPMCVNAAQAEVLVRAARDRGVFLMEAMWTRCLPVAGWVQDVVRRGGVGEVVRVYADFSLGGVDREGLDGLGVGPEDRLLDPKRAGGVLLDLGVYCLAWVVLAVYHTLEAGLRKPPTVIGATMTPYSPSDSWVDASTTVLMTLPSSPTGMSTCHATLSTSLYNSTDPGYAGDDPSSSDHAYSVPSARIIGTHGEIQIFGPLPRPQKARLFQRATVSSSSSSQDPISDADTNTVVVPGSVVSSDQGSKYGYKVSTHIFESRGDGTGMFWEADEAARCLRAGRLESVVVPLEESVEVIKIMDDTRRKCGLSFEGAVERMEWDENGGETKRDAGS